MSVVVLFAIATVFYLLGAVTPAVIFSLFGVVVEIAAWLTLFGTSSSENDSKNSET
jgi:uncharacterized membrane protein